MIHLIMILVAAFIVFIFIIYLPSDIAVWQSGFETVWGMFKHDLDLEKYQYYNHYEIKINKSELKNCLKLSKFYLLKVNSAYHLILDDKKEIYYLKLTYPAYRLCVKYFNDKQIEKQNQKQNKNTAQLSQAVDSC